MNKKEECVPEDLKNVYKQAEKLNEKDKSYLSCVQCSVGCSVSCKNSCITQSDASELNRHSQN